MNINEAFPSNYIKAVDLKGREVPVTIARVVMEDIGGEHKLVMYFNGSDKGMVVNKTNALNMSALMGDETDSWVGQTVTLYPTKVPFNGRNVDAIRVKPPMPSASFPPASPAAAAPLPVSGGGDLDDEIPFAPDR